MQADIYGISATERRQGRWGATEGKISYAVPVEVKILGGKKKNQENKNSREIKVKKIEAGGRESMGPGRVGGI